MVRTQWQIKELSRLWELLKVPEQKNDKKWNDKNWTQSLGRITRLGDDDGRPGETGWNSPLRKGSEKKRQTARVTVEIEAEGYGHRVAAGGCNSIMGLQNHFKQ